MTSNATAVPQRPPQLTARQVAPAPPQTPSDAPVDLSSLPALNEAQHMMFKHFEVNSPLFLAAPRR